MRVFVYRFYISKKYSIFQSNFKHFKNRFPNNYKYFRNVGEIQEYIKTIPYS